MGLLQKRVGTELKNNDQSSTLSNFFMSLFGFLLPIMFGVYLVYDAFWGSSNDNDLSPNPKSGRTSDGIPVAEAYVVNDGNRQNQSSSSSYSSYCSIM